MFFLEPRALFINLTCFVVVEDVRCCDICILWNITELTQTRLFLEIMITQDNPQNVLSAV